MRRSHGRCFGRIFAGLLLTSLWLLAPVQVQAQGAVTGTIALEERAGSPRGDLRDAVVWLEARDAVAMPAESEGAPRRASIAMRGREFLPRVQVVRAGGTVAFPNEDPFSHNVFSNESASPFDLGLYRRGATRAAAFPRPAVYPTYCNIHSKMVAFVVAVPTAWAAQPDADGRFTLRGVPAGRWRLRAWHYRAAEPVTRDVEVTGSGVADLRVTLDARAWVAAPHLNKFGRPYLVVRADRY